MREPPKQELDRGQRPIADHDRKAAEKRAESRLDMLATICFAFTCSWFTAAFFLILVLLALG